MDDQDPSVERLAPEDAFALVADETRFSILRTLQAASDTLPFSELRAAVGVRDSGRFSYHLGRLTGHFVREDNGGYALTEPGRRLVGAVLSGAYTAELDGETVAVDGACPTCGGALVARFEGHHLTVECGDCGDVYTEPSIPAGLVGDRPAAAAPGVLARWLYVGVVAADAGICLQCHGPLDRTLVLRGDDAGPGWVVDDDLLGMVFDECARCGHRHNAAVQIAVLTHPRVAAYHHAHGIDVRTTPPWALDWIEPGRGTVDARDPVRLVLPIPLDDETRTFVFDGDLALVEARD